MCPHESRVPKLTTKSLLLRSLGDESGDLVKLAKARRFFLVGPK